MTVSAGPAFNVLGIEVAGYRSHVLHSNESSWNEINCSVDVWVELLHSLGLEPLALGAFAVVADFAGDQWSFLKFPPEDIREMFGIAVDEINIWRPIVDHAVEQLSRGRLLTIEVDAFYLPDVAGTDYRRNHTKTSIGLNGIDPAGRTATYFHGTGLFALTDEDFDGALGWRPDGAQLAPYVEVVDVGNRRSEDVKQVAARQLARHLEWVPSSNPVRRMGLRLQEDLPWIAEMGVDGYHSYAFGVVRQCGAGAALAAAFLRWLSGSPAAAASFDRISELAKSLQFSVARAARGRAVDVGGILEEMAVSWETGISHLRRSSL